MTEQLTRVPFRETSAERRVRLPSERARLDLRALHRQPNQEGPLGVLAFVDGGAEGRQPPLGVASPLKVASERDAGKESFRSRSNTLAVACGFLFGDNEDEGLRERTKGSDKQSMWEIIACTRPW